MESKQQAPQRRILLVDYDTDNCKMMANLLGVSEYQITSAHTMTEGLRLAQNNSFDLCLLESRLSDGSGYELCQRIRAFDPGMPIVFYSGAAYERDRQQGLEAGAQAYLIKPNDLDRIENVVEELIIKSRSLIR